MSLMDARRSSESPLVRHHALTTRTHLAALCGVYLLLNTVVAGILGFVLALAFLVVGATGYRLLPARTVMRLRRAVPAPASVAWRLEPMLVRLSRRAGLRAVPELWLLPGAEVNALTIEGSEAPAIAVSDGALRFCTADELAAIFAHELSHLRNRDQYLMHVAMFVHTTTTTLATLLLLAALVSVPFALVGVVELPGLGVLAAAFALPALSALLLLSLSRTREFAADLDAVRLTGDVGPMAAALKRIERVQRLLERFGHRRLPLPEFLSTHPDLESRLAHLREASLEGL